MSKARFPCEKCSGTGERFGGKCYACKGRGGFSKSPEARAKSRDRYRARKIAEARVENQGNPALYLGVIRNSDKSQFLFSLRAADVRGEVWTPDQKATARAILDGITGQIVPK